MIGRELVAVSFEPEPARIGSVADIVTVVDVPVTIRVPLGVEAVLGRDSDKCDPGESPAPIMSLRIIKPAFAQLSVCSWDSILADTVADSPI